MGAMMVATSKKTNRSRMSRMRLVCILFAFLFSFHIWSQQSHTEQWQQQWRKLSDTSRALMRDPITTAPRRVLVFNHQVNHDEVVVPFLEALSAHDDLDTTLAVREKRFGIQEFIQKLAWKRPLEELDVDSITPEIVQQAGFDVFLDITCGDDLSSNPRFYRDLLAKTDVTLYCVVHHAERFKAHKPKFKLAKPWIRKNRLRFITLSPHVRTTLLKYWDDDLIVHAPVSVLPPIFSMSQSSRKVETSAQIKSSIPRVPYFAVQGNLEARRRNYTAILEQMSLLTDATLPDQLPKAKLMLIGSGTPPVFPEKVASLVEMRANLSYPAFYDAMANSAALIPAFASEEYYHTKASSTVAAAIIAGTPLLASQKLLDAYTYLPSHLAIVTPDSDNAVSAVKEGIVYLKQDPRIRSRMHLGLYNLRKKIIAENKQNLRQWISQDMIEDM